MQPETGVVRLQVRLPADLAEQLRIVAQQEDRSVNSTLVVAAREYVRRCLKESRRE
jgi:predicted HicB family RNase H-like nuclease